MCQKAKWNGQFVVNCPFVFEEYKKDVFCNFVYGFEPFKIYWFKRFYAKYLKIKLYIKSREIKTTYNYQTFNDFNWYKH